MMYQTVEHWDGGFQGRITITFGSGRVPRHWGLWFGYPKAYIQGVNGGRARVNGHSAAVTDYGRWGPPVSGDSIQINFWASGHAGQPQSCDFNHQTCNFS